MSTRHAIPLCALAVFAMTSAASAEVAVRIAAETASVFIHETFTLRLEAECDGPPETPAVPPTPGLAVVTVRRLPPDKARRRHAFQIGLIAEREGLLTVPPIAVRVGGETASTPPLRLKIRTPRPATEMALTVVVEPSTLRVGQPAIVTVTWTSAIPFSNCKQLVLEVPLLAEERCQSFPLDPPVAEAERIGVPVNNIRVAAEARTLPGNRQSLAFRYALIPRKPSVLRTPPARLVCAVVEGPRAKGETPNYFYNQFFSAPGDAESYERVYLAAPAPEVTVRAISEPGRNSHFAEIVGPCELRATAEPTQLVVGQPALLTVHLDKLAFARHLSALPSAALAGLRPEFQVSAEPMREAVTDHSRSFTYIVRPLRAGVACVPAIVIQTFRPDTGEYQTLRTAPIAVTVESGEEASPAAAPRLDSRPPIRLAGIRHNHMNEQPMIFLCDMLEFFGRHWWAFLPLPPLVWLALRPLIRRWDRCRRDPVFARAVGALRRFRQTVRHNEESAWRTYLADRLGLCAEALTAQTVAEALRARDVDAGLIAEAQRRFEERDAFDYGRRPAAPATSIHSLVRRLHKATLPLLVVWGLWAPLPGKAAEGPDELFTRAVELRAESPDAAQPLLVDAALQFESAQRYLNAGNAWFFAGENGRALASYRAAQRRFPFDAQLGESIDFLRANRGDSFPAPAGPTSKAGAVWTQFGTWMPSLRIGVFVLVYLAAWALFLAARLRGWRVRRTVWIALAAAVLVPLISVIQTSLQSAEGVVIEDATARLGPGYAYDAAFQQPLHKATEFSWLETRERWVRIRLPDGSEGWLQESDCIKIP